MLHTWQAEYANFVADSQVLDDEFLQMTQARSVIAVPLLKADIPIGTLLLVNTINPQAFAGWQTEQIGLLGVQAALAIQNATLFDEIRHRLDQLRLVNEVGRYATAILSPQSLIEGVADKLSDILHYDLVGLMLIEDDDLSVHSIFVRDDVLGASDENTLRATMQSVGLQPFARPADPAEPAAPARPAERDTLPGAVLRAGDTADRRRRGDRRAGGRAARVQQHRAGRPRRDGAARRAACDLVANARLFERSASKPSSLKGV